MADMMEQYKCIAVTQLGNQCKTNTIAEGIIKEFDNGLREYPDPHNPHNPHINMLPGYVDYDKSVENDSDSDSIESDSNDTYDSKNYSNSNSDCNNKRKNLDDLFVIPFIVDGDFPCRCCQSILSFDDLIKCTGSSEKYRHAFCKECVGGYVNSALDDRKAQIMCMMSMMRNEGCGGRYTETDIRLCIPEKIYSNFENIMDINDTSQFCKIFDDYTICPFCSKYGCIADQEILYVKCGRCEKTWCVRCRKEQHGIDPCCKIKDSTDLDGIRKIINETITEALTHTCPNCEIKYIKDTGCNMMTCASCEANSCYICGKLLPKRIINDNIIKYYHFKDSGSVDPDAICILWNDRDGKSSDHGNATYNNEKLRMKCQQLIDINENVIVKKIIYRELRKLKINVILPTELQSKCIIL